MAVSQERGDAKLFHGRQAIADPQCLNDVSHLFASFLDMQGRVLHVVHSQGGRAEKNAIGAGRGNGEIDRIDAIAAIPGHIAILPHRPHHQHDDVLRIRLDLSAAPLP
jgi:hypothetical protein